MKRILIMGLGVAMLIGAAGSASALSVADLQGQIESLLRQIGQLQAQQQSQVQVGTAIPASAGTVAPDSCKVWYDGCNTCTRSYAGGPLSCTEVQCIWNAGSSCKEYFDSASGTSVPAFCQYATPNLARGTSGSVVSALQQYLQAQGLLNANATGYFGPATESAVQQWQAQNGLVSYGTPYTTGWGTVGPRTWSALRRLCTPIVGGDKDAHGCIGSAGYTWCGSLGQCVRPWETQCPAPVSGTFSASPLAGSAPLTVSFTAEGYADRWINPDGTMSGVADRGYRYIDFGDGSTPLQIVCSNATASTCSHMMTHTYQAAGTFTATLYNAGGFINPAMTGGRSVVATQTISVSGTISTDPSSDPQCKRWFDGYGECHRDSVGGATASCTSWVANYAGPKGTPYCKEYFSGPVACTMEYAPVCGRPSGCVNTCAPGMACPAICQLAEPQTYGNKCQLTAAGAEYLYSGECTSPSANKPPVISGLSGPTSLSLNQTGTWSVTASDPENQSLSYQVTWGDEVSYPMAMNASVSSPVNYQTSTFTHSYASAGTYTVKVTVTDAQGKSAQTTTTVQVGGGAVACTLQYDPYCGQPPEPACRYSIPACMMATPGPTTYGNLCQLQAAGATVLYRGQCSTYGSGLHTCPNDQYCQCDASGAAVLCQ